MTRKWRPPDACPEKKCQGRKRSLASLTWRRGSDLLSFLEHQSNRDSHARWRLATIGEGSARGSSRRRLCSLPPTCLGLRKTGPILQTFPFTKNLPTEFTSSFRLLKRKKQDKVVQSLDR